MSQKSVATQEPNQSFRQIALANTGGGGMLLPQTFGDVVSFANIMAQSQHAIPRHLRGNSGACMAVTMQALRWEMDPFAVASKAYNVNDMIAYEAQLIAAVVHTRAPIARRPVYVYEGEGETRCCIVSCEMQDGSTKEYRSPALGSIKVKNSPLWKSDPDQQLGYFAIRSWARRHTPEVLLGVYAPDELDQGGAERARDVTPTLADRLKAAAPAAPGFSIEHVERETAGEQQDEEQGAIETVEAVLDTPAETSPEPQGEQEDRSGSTRLPAQPGLSSDPSPVAGDTIRAYSQALGRAVQISSLKGLHEAFTEKLGIALSEDDTAIFREVYALHQRRIKGELSVEDVALQVREIAGA